MFTDSTTKVDSEPPNGSNDDITNSYECNETLYFSAGTSNSSAGTSVNPLKERLRVWLPISYVRSSRNSNLMNMLQKMFGQNSLGLVLHQMSFGQNSSSLVIHQMTLDHNSLSLGPHCLMMSVHISSGLVLHLDDASFFILMKLDHSSSSLGPHSLMMYVHISSGLILHLDDI
ncbi:hypothetical protein Tco_1148344 [Tanacetum coccineum]